MKSRIREEKAKPGGGYHALKGGEFNLYNPKQQVLERTTCSIVEDNDTSFLEVRFNTVLPAAGRSIGGDLAQKLLVKQLPELMNSFMWSNINEKKADEHIKSVRVQQGLRDALRDHDLVAFIGNGSILPRKSGADPKPMEKAIPFQSPPELEIEIDTRVPDDNGGTVKVKGMGIPRGVTVITGGGFHGKSTLLDAIELGIYNVIPGDGRELVVTEPNAFKVRSEDGRNVVGVDISPFISTLPGDKETVSFSTMDASGSTSMAANIQEAVETGATSLIIDEDTCATNFLVRDAKMQELISNEPITPLVTKVGVLHEELGISTIVSSLYLHCWALLIL